MFYTLLKCPPLKTSLFFSVLNDNNFWKNKKPSSSHFCRPLHLQYRKETKESLKEDEERLRTEISSLRNFEKQIVKNDSSRLIITISHDIVITMLDGKAVNAITNTLSTQSCNVCSARPKEMNNLDVVLNKEISQESLPHGLSSLHCWIRIFQYILHLGYKMENKTFEARTPEEKQSVDAMTLNLGT